MPQRPTAAPHGEARRRRREQCAPKCSKQHPAVSNKMDVDLTHKVVVASKCNDARFSDQPQESFGGVQPGGPIHNEGPVVGVWQTGGVLEGSKGVLLLGHGVMRLQAEGHENLHCQYQLWWQGRGNMHCRRVLWCAVQRECRIDDWVLLLCLQHLCECVGAAADKTGR